METFLYTLHFIVCFVLIAVVLLQRGKGADLGASLGGGGANTIFGGRGAGNFLTRMTSVAAAIFMATSLSLSYLGYKGSDERLFDESEPFAVPGASGAAPEAAGGLEEIELPTADDAAGELIEIPQPAADAESTTPRASAPTPAESGGEAAEAPQP